MPPIEDIPAFLKIPQADRKAAWEKYRAERPLPVETKPKYLPITSLPGAKDDDNNSDA